MKEVARVYLSSNQAEYLVYDGNDNLISVVAVDGGNLAGAVDNAVYETVEGME